MKTWPLHLQLPPPTTMDADYQDLSALLRSYAALAPTNPREIDSPPFPTRTWLARTANQLKLYKLLVTEEELTTNAGRPWKLLFWKRVILEIERGLAAADQKTQEEEEIEEKILTYYISLQQQPAFPDISQTEIHTYYYGDPGDRKSWSRIDLHENKASISQGTTGLRSWGASVCLANYLILNRHLLEEQDSVLELGSGTGLLGILAHQLVPTNRLYLTDSNPSVLDRLQLNIDLNFKRSSQRNLDSANIKVVELDWNLACSSSVLPSPVNLSPSTLILGADVIYDPDLIPSLVRTIKLCLTQHPEPKTSPLDLPVNEPLPCRRSHALICGLVRAPSTWEKFLETCGSEGLVIEAVQIGESVELGRADRRGIVFPQALDRALLDLRMVRLTLPLPSPTVPASVHPCS